MRRQQSKALRKPAAGSFVVWYAASNPTKVYVGRKAGIPCAANGKTGKPVCKVGHCIFWSNGDVSADNATLCDKDF